MNSSPEVLSWSVVHTTHKTQRAVYHVGGLVYSLLCSDNGSNVFVDGTVEFHLPKSLQYVRDFHVLQLTYETKTVFRVFKKIVKNEWIYLGRRSITSIDSDKSDRYHIFYIS